MLPVLLLEEADFVVHLLQLVLNRSLLVYRRVYVRLANSQLIFALLNNLFLMSHSSTSLLDFSLHAFNLVTGSFI